VSSTDGVAATLLPLLLLRLELLKLKLLLLLRRKLLKLKLLLK